MDVTRNAEQENGVTQGMGSQSIPGNQLCPLQYFPNMKARATNFRSTKLFQANTALVRSQLLAIQSVMVKVERMLWSKRRQKATLPSALFEAKTKTVLPRRSSKIRLK